MLLFLFLVIVAVVVCLLFLLFCCLQFLLYQLLFLFFSCIKRLSVSAEALEVFLKAYIVKRLGLNGCAIDMQLGVLWFLLSLFYASVILRLIIMIKKNVFRALLCAGCFVIGILLSRKTSFPNEVLAGFCAVPYLYLGYLFKEYNDRIKDFYNKYAVIVSAGVSVFSLIYMLVSCFHKVNFLFCDFSSITDIIGPLLCVVFMLMVSQLMTKKKNIISSLVV